MGVGEEVAEEEGGKEDDGKGGERGRRGRRKQEQVKGVVVVAMES